MKHNIPGPGIEKEKFLPVLAGCSCKECADDCPCVQRFGASYNKDGTLQTQHLHSEGQKVMVECNRNCSCLKTCVNRVVQHGVNSRLELFWNSKKGHGVRTLEEISSGAFVCEYAGEVLSYEEAQKRSSLQTKADMNYIITVNEFCRSGVIKTHVDPRYFGNIGRFLNHSCEPNLFMVPVRVDTEIPLLALFANRKIKVGQELTFHYGISSVSESLNNSELEGKDYTLLPCYCGSQTCLGYLPFDKSLFDVNKTFS